MRLDLLGPTDGGDVLAGTSTDDGDGDEEEARSGAYFLTGTYLDDLDGESADDYLLEAHGCLPRLRTWTAELLHPRRHSRRLSWAGLNDYHYNILQ